MRSVHRFARLALVATALFAPQAVSAQDVLSWTMCTPGAFHSCHSVQLMTSPQMSADGTTRIGTDITITMHNLNGQISEDNTLWSGLMGVAFMQESFPAQQGQTYSHSTGLGGAEVVPIGVGGSGASHGTATDEGYSNPIAFLFGWSGQTYNGGFSYRPIGGCTPGNSYDHHFWTSAMTCGSSATASFSFSSNIIVDATGHWQARVWAIGDAGSGYRQDACRSGQGGHHWAEDQQFLSGTPSAGYFSAGSQQCDVLSGDAAYEDPQVAPEPVTIALLGTGLLGIGAARLRRRKKDGSVDG